VLAFLEIASEVIQLADRSLQILLADLVVGYWHGRALI